MKKLYTVLLVLLLGAMSFVGVWSLVDVDAKESARENRRLASFPKITLSSLEDGSFVSQLETYYSDTFPGREALLKANDTLNKFYMFSGATGSNMLVIDFTNDVGEGGQAQEPVKPEQGEEPPEVTPEDPPEVPVEEDPPVQEEEEPNYDDMEVTNEQFHRNESNVTIDIEIDGSQDIMSSKAALTEKQKEAILEKADFWETQTMIACSYSYYTAARGINPNFVFKHHLVKLDFKLVPGSIAGASKDIKVDKIEVRSEYKASFNVADKYDDGNVGLTFDADTTTLALTETDGSAFDGRLVTTFKDGQTIDGVIDDMGSLLVAPRDEYDLIITLSEVDEDGNHQTSEPYSNIKVLSVGTAKDPQPFVAGSEYLVTLTVYGKMDVRVSTTIKEWEDGGFYIPPTEDVPE